MRSRYLYGSTLAVWLVFAGQMMAQTTTLSQVIFQHSDTTGMVGFTLNQTARLNVLNLNTMPATAPTPTPANCTVELQFFDGQNNMLKQTMVANFAPGTATLLDLKREAISTTAGGRVEIRGVVTVNPTPSPAASPAAVGFCTVKTTLEIFDSNTLSTISLTSDTSPVGSGIVVPLVARAR